MLATRFLLVLVASSVLVLTSGCPGPSLGSSDQDGDGSPDVEDCAPLDPSIHPGAPDYLGDFTDSDCDGDDGELGDDDDTVADDDDDTVADDDDDTVADDDDDTVADDDDDTVADDDDDTVADDDDDDSADDDDDDSADDDDDDTVVVDDDDDTTGGSWTWTQVYSVVEANCSCHRNGQSRGGQDLGSTAQSAYDAWVNVPSSLTSSVLRVTPGEPDLSLVVWKLAGDVPFGGGDQMPLNGPYLSATVQEGIRSWIADDAPNN